MLKLNLGCKNHRLKGFENIDIDPSCKPDRIVDARHLQRYYGENVADTIYAGHLIEHFDCLETPNLLIEWVRVLKKGGELILSFPDVEKTMALFTAGKIGLKHINKYIFANEVGEYQSHEQVMSLRIMRTYLGNSVKEITDCPYVQGGDMNWQTTVRFVKK